MSVRCCQDHFSTLGISSVFLGFGSLFGYLWIRDGLNKNTLNKIAIACCTVLQNPPTEECKELLASTDYFKQLNITEICDVMDTAKGDNNVSYAVNVIFTLGVLVGGVGFSIWWSCSERGAGWRQKINNYCVHREYETIQAETEQPRL